MTRRSPFILFAIGTTFFLLFLIGSTPTQKVASVPPQLVVPSFDFTPPVEGVTKSNDISFILLRPRFDKEYQQQYRGDEPDKSFIENMQSDFVEMLTARGYRYTGPYSSYEELVYSEKKNADLVMEIEMKWETTGNQNALKVEDYINPVTKVQSRKYWFDGPGTLGGRLNMWFSEPFTQQKIWVKAIDIPSSPVYLKTHYKYEREKVLVESNKIAIPSTDPGLWNAYVPVMEKIYRESLQIAWRHLEPEELLIKKKEANEIKEKSGYSRDK